MKYTLAIVALFVCASAMAEEGHVSQAQLADFGLAGMSTMSDAEATEVRGQGFAFAASISASRVPGAGNVSPAVAFGRREAVAVSGSRSELEVEGYFGAIGGGSGGFGGFIGFFGLEVSTGSAGFAYAHAR